MEFLTKALQRKQEEVREGFLWSWLWCQSAKIVVEDKAGDEWSKKIPENSAWCFGNNAYVSNLCACLTESTYKLWLCWDFLCFKKLLTSLVAFPIYWIIPGDQLPFQRSFKLGVSWAKIEAYSLCKIRWSGIFEIDRSCTCRQLNFSDQLPKSYLWYSINYG